MQFNICSYVSNNLNIMLLFDFVYKIFRDPIGSDESYNQNSDHDQQSFDKSENTGNSKDLTIIK
jgi:hypothetical protein